jgi:quercetin dioxygenase-like cupin family protein
MSFLNLQEIQQKEIVKGFDARFVHTQHLTLAYVDIKAGSILPEHHHVHEQVTNVLEGKLQFTLEGNTQILEYGKVVVIPSNAKHSAIALTDCKVMDVFYPCREDYK